MTILVEFHRYSLSSLIASFGNSLQQRWRRLVRVNLLKLSYNPLKDGTVFESEGVKLFCLGTPGHTSDHGSFVLEEEKVLFSGDCVLGTGTTVFENLAVYVSSLKKIMSHFEESSNFRIFPGHGPVVEDGRSRVRDYIKHRVLRENQILSILSSGTCKSNAETKKVAVEQILKVLYPEMTPQLTKAAESNILLHLYKLRDEGKVEYHPDSLSWQLCTAHM
eukprot:TRINITY_DN7043_c0_g1_i1.p1 TRINITY_DN7043_c0_g1~~TRINITY_DN7043_c0_g1_i1.p1  ORF type:complete len:220 (-),score=44.90 TRINITY_DN7043_c0_g1_i1:76-735(-)